MNYRYTTEYMSEKEDALDEILSRWDINSVNSRDLNTSIEYFIDNVNPSKNALFYAESSTLLGLNIPTSYYKNDIIEVESDNSVLNKHGNRYYIVNIDSINYIITNIPLDSKETYDLFLKLLDELEPKRPTEEERLLYILNKSLNFEIDQTVKSTRSKRRDIRSYQQYITNNLKQITDNNTTLIGLRAMIKKNKTVSLKKVFKDIKDCKKLPVVEDIYIKNKILYIHYGKTYINATVQKGVIKNDAGMYIPETSKEKIYIGDLTLEINLINKTINCRTKDPNDAVFGYPHPHAGSGGNICAGDSYSTIQDFIENLEIKKLVTALYSWTISYSSGPYMVIQAFYDARQGKDMSESDYEDIEDEEDYDEDD